MTLGHQPWETRRGSGQVQSWVQGEQRSKTWLLSLMLQSQHCGLHLILEMSSPLSDDSYGLWRASSDSDVGWSSTCVRVRARSAPSFGQTVTSPLRQLPRMLQSITQNALDCSTTKSSGIRLVHCLLTLIKHPYSSLARLLYFCQDPLR